MELQALKDWLPLAGVVVGWGLNQFGQWFVFRRDERKVIGRALTDLMEIRHRFLAIPKTVELMAAKLNLPAHTHIPLTVALGSLFPQDEGLAKRYAESVSLVSGMNPILGFRLRSQDMVGPFLHQLRQAALQDSPQAITMFTTIEEKLIHHLSPQLSSLILELAWEHGWRTWWRTRARLRRPIEMPEDFWDSLSASVAQQPQA